MLYTQEEKKKERKKKDRKNTNTLQFTDFSSENIPFLELWYFVPSTHGQAEQPPLLPFTQESKYAKGRFVVFVAMHGIRKTTRIGWI